MLRAAIYARYSSDNQRQESIETQFRICEEHCRQKGYIIVKHYKDQARTGTTTARRDGFNFMLSEANKDVWDILIVYTLDRTARQELDYYLYKQELIDCGVKYEYATQSFDPTTADGQLFEGIQVAQAAYYSRNLSAKVKDGKETNARACMFQGGTPPLGYAVGPDLKFIVNQTEAPAVRLIFAMYINQRSYGDIVKALTAAGFRTRTGKTFCRNSLFDIIANPIYKGTYVFRKDLQIGRKVNWHKPNPDALIIPNAVPPIIPEADWNKAQDRKKSNKHVGLRNSTNYILSGVVVCGECGHKMTGECTGNKGYHYHWYQCTEQINRGRQSCPGKKIKQEQLESLVINAIESNLTFENLDRFCDKTAAANKNLNQDKVQELQGLTNEKSNLEKKLNNLYALLEGGCADEFDIARLNTLKSQIRACKTKIEASKSSQSVHFSKEEILNAWEKFKVYIKQKNDPKLIRAVLQKLVNRVIVYSDRVSIEIRLSNSKKLVALE